MSEIVLVGLGVSGLACAMELQQHCVAFTAYEKESVPGGLTRSERINGFAFDYGPHVILDSPEIFDRLSLDLENCACKSTIFLDTAQVISVPAPIQHHLHHLPLAQRMRTLFDIVQRNSKPLPSNPNNFQQRILAQSGKTLFDLFFQGYEAKRLRFPLAEIDAAMPNRIQPPALAQLFGLTAAANQAACGGCDARFRYPRAGGIDALPRAMADTLPRERLNFQHTLLEIDVQKKQITFTNNRREFFEHLVLSLPLPEIVMLLKNAPRAILEAAEQLVYSSIYVLNLGIDSPFAHSWGIARIPKRDVDFYRVSVPSHYCKASAPNDSTCLTIEVGHHEQRYPLTAAEARRHIYAGLKRLGILTTPDRVTVEWLHNIRYGHIIYNHQTRAALAQIFAYLNEHGVYACGKYGAWRDMLITHAIQSGVDTARRILTT